MTSRGPFQPQPLSNALKEAVTLLPLLYLTLQILNKLYTNTKKVMKRILALIHISCSHYISQIHNEKLLSWKMKK